MLSRALAPTNPDFWDPKIYQDIPSAYDVMMPDAARCQERSPWGSSRILGRISLGVPSARRSHSLRDGRPVGSCLHVSSDRWFRLPETHEMGGLSIPNCLKEAF